MSSHGTCLLLFFECSAATLSLPCVCFTYIGSGSPIKEHQQRGVFETDRCVQGAPVHQMVIDARMLKASVLGLVSLVDGALEGGPAPSTVRFGVEVGLEKAHVFDFGAKALYPMIWGPETLPDQDMALPTNVALTQADTSTVLGLMHDQPGDRRGTQVPEQPVAHLLFIGRAEVMRGCPGMLPFMVHMHHEIEHASLSMSPMMLNLHLRSLFEAAASVEAACRLPPDSVVRMLSCRAEYAVAHEKAVRGRTTRDRFQGGLVCSRLDHRPFADAMGLHHVNSWESIGSRCFTCGNPCYTSEAACRFCANNSAMETRLAVFRYDSPRRNLSPRSAYALYRSNVSDFRISQVLFSGARLSVKLRCDDLWTHPTSGLSAGGLYVPNPEESFGKVTETIEVKGTGRRGRRGQYCEGGLGTSLTTAILPCLLRACNIAHCEIRWRPFESKVLQLQLPVLAFFLRRHFRQEAIRCAVSLFASTDALSNIGGWEQRSRLINSVWKDMWEALKQEIVQMFPPSANVVQESSNPQHPVPSFASASKLVLTTVAGGKLEGSPVLCGSETSPLLIRFEYCTSCAYL